MNLSVCSTERNSSTRTMIAIFLVAALAVCHGSPRRPVPFFPKPGEIAQQKLDSRIINGKDADIIDFPWQASLQYRGRHYCGASIISNLWLVTAAHCTQNDIRHYKIEVGKALLDSKDTLQIAEIINHENYGSGSGFIPNDISLIKLSTPLTLNGLTIDKINLANGNIREDSECKISGWGVTTTGGGSLASTLQYAETKIMSADICDSEWPDSINDGHVCVAGEGFEGSCNGDSGGPLSCIVNGENTLVGATSWGASGCYTNYPSVYSKISYFREWINMKTGI